MRRALVALFSSPARAAEDAAGALALFALLIVALYAFPG